MTNLEKILTRLCPNGIEYSTIGEVCTIAKGEQLNRDGLLDNGKYPVINGGINPSGYWNEYNYPKDSITISQGGASAGFVSWQDTPFWAGAHCHVIINPLPIINYRFLYHLLKMHQEELMNSQIGAGIPSVGAKAIAAIVIPLPPLEAQREIVRILDEFTLLTAELTAELTARKKQYAYYNEKLFEDIKPKTRIVSISELGKWAGGKTPSMSIKEYWNGGTIPWISSKDMKESELSDTEDHITLKAVSEESMTVFPKGCTAIVTRSGILKHTFPVAYIPFETTVNQDIKILIPNTDVIPRYAFHLLNAYKEDIRISTKKQGGTVDSLDYQKIMSYQVPLPPLDVQDRIVNVLDNFDAICSDLKIGLPAEIEARKKQYEYYRNFLLDFDGRSQSVNVERERERERESRSRADKRD